MKNLLFALLFLPLITFAQTGPKMEIVGGDNINTGTKIEDSWISSTGKTLKYIRTFPASIMSYGAAYCFGSIYLVQGETLRPYIWHNTGLTRYLRIPQTGDTGGRGFNNLNIVEQ